MRKVSQPAHSNWLLLRPLILCCYLLRIRAKAGAAAQPAHPDDDAVRADGGEQRHARVQLRPRPCAPSLIGQVMLLRQPVTVSVGSLSRPCLLSIIHLEVRHSPLRW